MPLTQLTEREKLALSFAAYTGCDDWAYLYHMSIERPRKTISKTSSAISRWKHSPKVVTYLRDQQAAAAARIVQAKKEAIYDFIERLPEKLRQAIKDDENIIPEEAAYPPTMQKIRLAMTREEFESPDRINPRNASVNEMEYARANGIDPSGTAAVYVPDVPGAGARTTGDYKKAKQGQRISSDTPKTGVLPNMIDFRNREELLNYYNQKANAVTDEKLRFDIVKLIADQEQMKANVSDKGKITRAWLPLRCYECPLYVSQKSKIKELENNG